MCKPSSRYHKSQVERTEAKEGAARVILLIPKPEETARAPRVLVVVAVVAEEAAQASAEAGAGAVAAVAGGGAAATALLLAIAVGAGAGAVALGGAGTGETAGDDGDAVADAEGVEEAHCCGGDTPSREVVDWNGRWKLCCA